MTAPVAIWTNPAARAAALLAERGVPVEQVRYLDEPSSTASGSPARSSTRGSSVPSRPSTRSSSARVELGLVEADRDTVLDALATHPELIERPVRIAGDRAVAARPPKRLLER
jgi:arsenate reductase